MRKRIFQTIVVIVLVIVLAAAYLMLRLPGSTKVIVTVLGQIATCERVPGFSLRSEPGPGYPGDAGAARWGIPEETPETLRVRRSWTSLSDEEKKQYVDGILLLKATTFDSGLPGAERADYASLCQAGQSYERSLLDYYAELHLSAFATMGGTEMTRMAHGAPHFLPWHRYLLLRMERDMQVVLDDPTYTLPYWDWDDCEDGSGDGSNPCPAIFDEDFLGSHGGLDDNQDVKGYLIDQGYELNVWTEAGLGSLYNIDSVVCGARPLQRSVGTDQFTNYAAPSSSETITDGYERPFYDVEPYDKCTTDDTQSFRMYLEGYRPNDEFPCYLDGRCARHGLGHIYVGGDMVNGANPNDPTFFLHHANVDRIWAMWQDHNRQDADTAVDYGNPGFPDAWRVPLFNYPDIVPDDMFDFRALGYIYDTNESE